MTDKRGISIKGIRGSGKVKKKKKGMSGRLEFDDAKKE